MGASSCLSHFLTLATLNLCAFTLWLREARPSSLTELYARLATALHVASPRHRIPL